jgi:sporadic carbohydrate cluster protein (TIGR04323 family)
MKIVGYITSDFLRKGFVAQQIQNMSIRKFLEERRLQYLLSWSEYKGKAPFVLTSLLQENFYEGICFYSVEQLYTMANLQECLTQIKSRELWLGFACESFVVDDVQEALSFIWMKRELEKKREDLGYLWDSQDIFCKPIIQR